MMEDDRDTVPAAPLAPGHSAYAASIVSRRVAGER